MGSQEYSEMSTGMGSLVLYESTSVSRCRSGSHLVKRLMKSGLRAENSFSFQHRQQQSK